jgi:hypothetical protein
MGWIQLDITALDKINIDHLLRMLPMCLDGAKAPNHRFIIVFIVVVTIYTPLLDFGRFFSFLILYTAGRTPWTGDLRVAKPLPTHRTTQTQNRHTEIHASNGIEPTIPVFERVKKVEALESAATASGIATALRDKLPFQSFTVTERSVCYKTREVSDRRIPGVHKQYKEIAKFRTDHEPLQIDGK